MNIDMNEVNAAIGAEKNLSNFEQEQKEKGWNPEGPKSAEEWARAEPLYKEIKARGSEIKQLKRTMDQLVEHMKKQESYAYEKAMKELNQQRQHAVNVGDSELVNRIDKEKESLPQMPKEKPAAVVDFEERNAEWLTSTSFESMEMREWAYRRDAELRKLQLDPDTHMNTLEEHLKKKFPDFFNSKNPKDIEEEMISPSVEMGNSSREAPAKSSNKKKFSMSDLSPEQKQVAKDFERLGIMKTEDYIKDLIRLGSLK